MSTSGAAPAPILTDAELKLLQALIYQECGMAFDERRTHFLQDRLLRRLKEAPPAVAVVPRVLGVDEWAERKGQE